MPPSKKGPRRDMNVVAQAKALYFAGETITKICEICGRSRPTIRQYIDLEDESCAEINTMLEETRDENQRLMLENLWRISHKVVLAFEEKLGAGEVKAHDLIVAGGVFVDKIEKIVAINRAHNAKSEPKQSLTINLFSSGGDGGGSQPRPIDDAVEVPFLELPIQGDDNGTGRGEDILGLPGSGTDDAEYPEH